ncbi:hypothetical protein ACNAN0_11245 [Agrilactobacillus fermenti]|uniref:hypothetical protein n=1 Tax=Agrilactobacillus fermenti TaxID=2586909 RepID=UPI001E467614|nr:hypothetical protein [Agrilactobacillus fermenti]MCD2256960.1 hypothetical protein [Agrilactobacillus fermenti]
MTRVNKWLVLLSLSLSIILLIFSHTNINSIHAAPTTQQVGINNKANYKLAPPKYPDWLLKAIVGTNYTPDQYLALPDAKKQAIQAYLHPTQSKLASSLQSQLTKYPSTKQADDNSDTDTLSPLLIASASTHLATASANDTTNATADVEAAQSNIEIVLPKSTNFPNFSDGDFSNLMPYSFTLDPSSELTSDDYQFTSASYNASTDDVTLDFSITFSGIQKLTPEGKKLIVDVTNGSSATTKLTVNVWRTSIQRPSVTLNVGNGYQLQYMFNNYYTGNPTAISHTTPTNNAIDIPNFNMLTPDGKRVYSLFNDVKATKIDTFYLPTTSALMMGDFKQKAIAPATGSDYYQLYKFDQIKHVHMWQDSSDVTKIHLEYDGYFIKGFGSHTNPITIHVKNTLYPNNNGDQMAMTEQLTNKTNSGATAADNDLTGIYYARQFDTQMGPDNNRRDDVPIYYANQITTGVNAGKNTGVYFRSPSLNSPYVMNFNFDYPNAPDGWLGTHWIANLRYTDKGSALLGSSDFINTSGRLSFRSNIPPFQIFSGPDDPGENSSFHTPDTLAFGNPNSTGDISGGDYDSAIDMKWSRNRVGTFSPNTTQNIAFNGGLSNIYAPTIRADSYLRVKPDATSVTINGTASDINSPNVHIYYSIDTPIDRGNPPAESSSNKLASVSFANETVPHSEYKSFSGKITDAAEVAKLKDGQTHHIYLYAYDTTFQTSDSSLQDYNQDVVLLSNVLNIPVNEPAHVSLHFRDRATGADIIDPVTKQGYVGDTYNFNNGSPNTTTTTSATDLLGSPPAYLKDKYTLLSDTADLPTTGKGTLAPDTDGSPMNINYYYNDSGYAQFTSFPTKLYFGKHPTSLSIGDYHIVRMDGPDLTVKDTTADHKFTVQAKVSKHLTNETDATKTIPDALGYQNSDKTITLTPTMVSVYANTDAASNVDLSNKWWPNVAKADRTADNQSSGPILRITKDNRSDLKVGQYAGEIDWSLTRSEN